MIIDELHGKHVEIESTQSTFIILKAGDQLVRFNFNDKKEFLLTPGKTGTLECFQEHPLLINYNENWASTYINSKVLDIDAFVDDIKLAIKQVVGDWRKWSQYVTNYYAFIKNIEEGSGLMSDAPFSITREIIAVCEKHKIRTKSFHYEPKPSDYKIWFIDDNYVIAKDLTIHLEKAKSNRPHKTVSYQAIFTTKKEYDWEYEAKDLRRDVLLQDKSGNYYNPNFITIERLTNEAKAEENCYLEENLVILHTMTRDSVLQSIPKIFQWNFPLHWIPLTPTQVEKFFYPKEDWEYETITIEEPI